MKKQNQLSVPLDQHLREFVEQSAEREDRSAAAFVRHLVAEAARRAQTQQEAA